ncbi:3-(3-hydroxy-phenyl)propionate/3-hydroxycinnamic acid hydroxylase [bacterium YEK0313]|nr:3-(3-hydroxy-phenyl)propionate/3-hydroxycinnamic acid hydroxylase [bacterium YEK0313]
MAKGFSTAAADIQSAVFEYSRSPDQDAATPPRHPVIVVGAGPVGLAVAIDLAQSGVPVVLLDEDDALSNGSRAICFAKRSLEIFDRLGCGQGIVDKGIVWRTGKVFFRDQPVYSFDLQPEAGYKRPAFVNLQQYYVEAHLLERAIRLDNLDIRWKSRVTRVVQHSDHVRLAVETPEGIYEVEADWVAACDGGRSTTRQLLGLESKGRVFKDRFLIADIKMEAEFPTERWFWFDPPFHPGQSVLLHKQPDDVWRVDFQLGWDADPVAERDPARVIPRVKALLGDDTPFSLEWVSVYTFVCMRMDRFRHGRVLFAGDAAHGVSPFGARGANSGIQDAENLAWKLRLVINGKAPEALLDSYDSERVLAADENILHSTRSTDFITPKNQASRDFRNAALDLSRRHGFARRLVNSGRLSVPAVLTGSPLNTGDTEPFDAAAAPGAVAPDAPVEIAGRDAWLLDRLGGRFTILVFAGADDTVRLPTGADIAAIGRDVEAVATVLVAPDAAAAARLASAGADAVVDAAGLVAKRYDARPGTTYLLRPDQHVCARFRAFAPDRLRAALLHATANG